MGRAGMSEVATAEGPTAPDQQVLPATMVTKATGKAVEESAAARAELAQSWKVAGGRCFGGCEGAGRGGGGDGQWEPLPWEPLGEWPPPWDPSAIG